MVGQANFKICSAMRWKLHQISIQKKSLQIISNNISVPSKKHNSVYSVYQTIYLAKYSNMNNLFVLTENSYFSQWIISTVVHRDV